jgi:hypothetical protein
VEPGEVRIRSGTFEGHVHDAFAGSGAAAADGKRLCDTLSRTHHPRPPPCPLSSQPILPTVHHSTCILHLGQHYYSQLTACYPILHITLDRDSLRPASPININITTLLHHPSSRALHAFSQASINCLGAH